MAPQLGQSMEDYLEAVLILSRSGKRIRITDISNKVGVKKSSVVCAIKKLKSEGYLIHEKYGDVELTQKGEDTAKIIYKRHKTILAFFTEVLGVEKETAENDACEMEHHISEKTMEKLLKFIEAYREADCEETKWLDDKLKKSCSDKKEKRDFNIYSLRSGDTGEVLEIEGSSYLRNKLLTMGVSPGTPFKIIQSKGPEEPVEIRLKGYNLSLREEEAKCVKIVKNNK